ncbi:MULTISPECIES: AraC family transcriptional regulator [Paenibacillus]|uniref:AraC family transcriptional regulator n=1 Tax=Paenibacillus TaxID=44249 RepID=UPI0035709EBE
MNRFALCLRTIIHFPIGIFIGITDSFINTSNLNLFFTSQHKLGIIRFQSALKEFHKRNYSNLTDLALEYGYYDQSHFTNSFSRYYGLPVKRLTRS